MNETTSTKTVIYEIINMSDMYTLESNDFKAACVATLILGRGAYGLREVDGNTEMPIMIFGMRDDWSQEHFGMTIAEMVESVSDEALAGVLDSVVIGNRKAFNAAISRIPEDEHEAFWLDWHDDIRTSMNDIGRRAKELTMALRKRGSGPTQ